MSTHLPPLPTGRRTSLVSLNAGAKAVPSSAATAVPGPSGVTATSALTAAASKKAGGFNVAMIAQLALEKKRGQMKYVAKMNKENLLKDKALYRAEREINLNHFRELMNVFQQHGSKSMTMKDFKESFGQVLGEGLSEEQMGLLFMKIDANTDNAVDWDEFSTFMLLRAERQTKMLEEASTSL
ncbi:EF-hand calcium binding domain 8, partial [Rhizoclosmatium hyalinum]